jgi:hypothetical protein
MMAIIGSLPVPIHVVKLLQSLKSKGTAISVLAVVAEFEFALVSSAVAAEEKRLINAVIIGLVATQSNISVAEIRTDWPVSEFMNDIK